ncbi:MAG: SDR family oxidoreductase [Deltaproteobacteria bacterium]|nr:SDR family oxidoreductase [Deltaproteobacteria bacterium]
MDGKVVVVAGGSSGFGEAAARRFLAEGARVMLAARGGEKLREVAQALAAEAPPGGAPHPGGAAHQPGGGGASHSGNAHPGGGAAGGAIAAQPCDITDWAQCKALAEAALARFGRLDAAVNSAGYEDNAPVAELEPARVEKMVAVQFTGALYFIQHMAKAMAQGGGGSIITVSSLTATLVAEGYAPYAGAKAGINHASRIAASEFGPQRVRVNVISPTTVETPMIAALFATPGVREAMIAETPLGELPGVEDVANLLLFLASGESAFITGENIHIDGGGALRRLPRRAEMLRSMQQAAQSAAPRPQPQPQAKGTGA